MVAQIIIIVGVTAKCRIIEWICSCSCPMTIVIIATILNWWSNTELKLTANTYLLCRYVNEYCVRWTWSECWDVIRVRNGWRCTICACFPADNIVILRMRNVGLWVYVDWTMDIQYNSNGTLRWIGVWTIYVQTRPSFTILNMLNSINEHLTSWSAYTATHTETQTRLLLCGIYILLLILSYVAWQSNLQCENKSISIHLWSRRDTSGDC